MSATYDKLNRIILRNYSANTPTVGFFYDGTGLDSVPANSKGKTTKVASSVSETKYMSFDEMGRLLTHRQRTDGNDYDTSYTYNLSGALIEETYPSLRVVRNTLNQDGELSQVQSKKDSTHGYWAYANSFTYNAAGALTRMQVGNGRWETAEFNNRLQVTKLGLGSTDAAQDLLELDYSYGTSAQNNGSLREQTIKVPAVGVHAGFDAIQTYTYDDLNRIQSATEVISASTTWKQTFSYDRFGNRSFNTTGTNTTTLGSCAAEVCNPSISTSNNRYSSGQGYSYDANGAVTEDAAGQRFGYDAESRQKEFFAGNNSGSTPDATYEYDGEGRRVKKVSATETTIFVYDASSQLIAEYSTELATTPQVSYLTTDQLGSTRVITDENGDVTGRKDFGPFGDGTVTAQRTTDLGYNPPNIRQDFTGYQKDEESQLEYAQARYFNPTHGRFTSVDPLTASATIRNPQTFNRYSYGLNSPYKFTDPLGLSSVLNQRYSYSEGLGAGGAFSSAAAGGQGLSLFDTLSTFALVNLPGINAVSVGSDRKQIPLTQNDRKALQKGLQKLVPGTQVNRNGQIAVPRGEANSAASKLLNGISNMGRSVTIAVNNFKEISTRLVNSNGTTNYAALTGKGPSDSVVYWDPNASAIAEERVSNDLIISSVVSPEMTLAHELIHAYNSGRSGEAGALEFGQHYFTEGDNSYMEDVKQNELRAVGYGFNQPGDITENQIRRESGYRPRASYAARSQWIAQPK